MLKGSLQHLINQTEDAGTKAHSSVLKTMSGLGARDLAIELPIDEREELFVFFWADGSESGLIMMGKRLVESCFFNGLVIKEGGKFVGGGNDGNPNVLRMTIALHTKLGNEADIDLSDLQQIIERNESLLD